MFRVDWVGLVKQYVWSNAKTPYLVRVPKLNQFQARSEIFVYSIFLSFLFFAMGVLLQKHFRQQGDVLVWWLSIHAFSIFVTGSLFGVTKHVYAAMYCWSAPVSVFMILITDLLALKVTEVERLALLAFALGWMWYGVRIVHIALRFPQMPEDVIQDPTEEPPVP